MAKPERRDPAKEAFWRRMLVRFGRSDLTVRDFCFEHELSEASFYAWRREISRRNREARGGSTTPSAASACSPVFVNVHVDDASLGNREFPIATAPIRSVAASAIEVIPARPGTNGRRSRRRLVIRPGFDADSLRRLLALLEAEESPSASDIPEKPSC